MKKQSNTLQAPDGDTIEQARLAKLLHDVAEEVFTSLFTIGHEEIVAGGEALLHSDGEVGRALFSASRGTTDLTAVLRRLDERASELVLCLISPRRTAVESNHVWLSSR